MGSSELALWVEYKIKRALVDRAGDPEMSTAGRMPHLHQGFGTNDLEHKKGPQIIRVSMGKGEISSLGANQRWFLPLSRVQRGIFPSRGL